MTKLWIMKTWRQKIWFIGIRGQWPPKASERVGNKRSPLPVNPTPVMSSKNPPQLWAPPKILWKLLRPALLSAWKKSHLHTDRFLPRMEVSDGKSNRKIKPMHVEVLKRYLLQRKAPACVGLLLLRQLTGVWFIFGNIPGSGGEHQFVCCHYFESNTICWPCALPRSISLSGINIW